MRHLRIKPTETDTIMHVYNRISGSSGDFPFGNPLTSHHCIAFVSLLYSRTIYKGRDKRS